MKIIHMDFLNELAQLLDKYGIQSLNVESDSLTVGFDDYYDKLKFEGYASGIFVNVTSTEDYKVNTAS